MADICIKKKLDGKVAIITGGASGIGEATAYHFANHGARAVVIADIQDDKGRVVAESIGPGRCSYVRCDITVEEQINSLIDWTVKTYGGLDVMFCNAATTATTTVSDQTILDLDVSQLDRVMRLNARGTAVCVKLAARKMVELGTRGSIVCTTSIAASRGVAKMTDYCMSKHAVLGLVRSASIQLGVHGIRVNCVSPSAVVTPMLRECLNIKNADDVEQVWGPMIRLKGVALTVDHVAEAVAFLASDESAFVTGHDLVLDGGITV